MNLLSLFINIKYSCINKRTVLVLVDKVKTETYFFLNIFNYLII